MADYKKYQGEVHAGTQRDAPYPVSRLAPAVELVDLAQQIAHADNMLTTQATGKLKLIAEQIKTLQAAAHEVLAETKHAQQLHRAKCNFKKIPGKVYHLYETPKGDTLFSMLSPEEWGTAPHRFLGSYRLENDMSWQGMQDDPREPPQSDELLVKLLSELKRS